jgi:transketolase
MSGSVKDMRDSYADALVEVGKQNERVILIDTDVAHPTHACRFREHLPDRYVQLGLAEQNAVSFAAGLSTLGFIPIVDMFGCFMSRRACDQVSVHVAYAEFNVKLIGAYAGLTSPNTGATHQAVQDVAIMRSMPNMVVVEPADGLELRQALMAIVEYRGPVYFRMVRGDVGGGSPSISPPGYRFEIGKGVVLRNGSDIALIGSGLMVSRCLQAAEVLSEQGVSAKVVNISTIKPLDEDLLVKTARQTGAVVTAENHSIVGGLGGAVAEVLMERCPVPMKRVGIQDRFGESGKLEELFEEYGLTSARVVEAAQEVLVRKRGNHESVGQGR